MPRQQDPYERKLGPLGPRRGGLGHWIPLLLTLTVASIGLAAWVWSERRSDEEGEDDDHRQTRPDGGPTLPGYGDLSQERLPHDTAPRPAEESSSYMTRMSGALRRAPSPQQILDSTSRTVVAGVTAASAAVGNALFSIREEDKNAYKDHETWEEEAEARKVAFNLGESASGPSRQSLKKQDTGHRKTVAVVISADVDGDAMGDGEDYMREHASILSHLPKNTNFSSIRLFVLIYAPWLREHPLDVSKSRPPASSNSSFSIIDPEQAHTPSEDTEKPHTSSTFLTSNFNALWLQSKMLVENETMILPFTTRTGHVHILRHLTPDVVYLQESLAGNDGDVITHLQTWLRHDVILVVGADGGHGGLADSESEPEHTIKPEHWWEREDRVGKGRGVVVVEGIHVGDDWARRIEGVE